MHYLYEKKKKSQKFPLLRWLRALPIALKKSPLLKNFFLQTPMEIIYAEFSTLNVWCKIEISQIRVFRFVSNIFIYKSEIPNCCKLLTFATLVSKNRVGP